MAGQFSRHLYTAGGVAKDETRVELTGTVKPKAAFMKLCQPVAWLHKLLFFITDQPLTRCAQRSNTTGIESSGGRKATIPERRYCQY